MDTRSTIVRAQQKCAEARKKIGETKFGDDQERKEFVNWFKGLQEDFADGVMLLTGDLEWSLKTAEVQATKDAAPEVMSHFLSLCVLKIKIDKLFPLLPNTDKSVEDNDVKKILSGAFFQGFNPNFVTLTRTVSLMSVKYGIPLPTAAQISAQLSTPQQPASQQTAPAQQPKPPTPENSKIASTTNDPSSSASSAAEYAAASSHSHTTFKPKSDNSPSSSPESSKTPSPENSKNKTTPPPSPPLAPERSWKSCFGV